MNDPEPMDLFVKLPATVSERKLRLVVLASCTPMLKYPHHKELPGAIGVLDAYLEDFLTGDYFTEVSQRIWQEWRQSPIFPDFTQSWQEWEELDIQHWAVAAMLDGDPEASLKAICQITGDKRATRYIRDIFGNHLCTVVADAAWITPTVASIAAAIYEDRAFERLPILADALEEAGCTVTDLLLHCRQPGEHVRGCWAVDLVLGKK